MKRHHLKIRHKESVAGMFFVLPWVLGFVFLFLRPVLSSLIYSLSNVEIKDSGIVVKFIGIAHYVRAFTIDPEILPALIKSVSDLVYQVPLIVLFSLFIALILNQKFRGRIFVRTIFFLPVIIASGVIIGILKQDLVSQMFLSGSKSSTMVQATVLRDIMLGAGFAPDFINRVSGIINNIFELSWKSGIQILLFIAGLQTVPSQLYEVAKIEGATAWESFWKVTFPLITPILLLNIIYSIIDSFTDSTNVLMKIILNYAKKLDFSYSSALAWMYFVLIGIIIFVVYRIINKRTFYTSN